jgi:hypothetical protein
MQTPWRFTTWLDLLDHWQSLVAGVLAFNAAVIVVVGAEWFARRRDRREVAAIRASLVVEVQQFTDTLLRVREMLRSQSSLLEFTRRDLLTFIEFHQPVVYPAIADRIGLLGSSLAKAVVGFYADVERVRYTAKLEADDHIDQIAFVVGLIEDTCRERLPLLEALGADKTAEQSEDRRHEFGIAALLIVMARSTSRRTLRDSLVSAAIRHGARPRRAKRASIPVSAEMRARFARLCAVSHAERTPSAPTAA